MLIGLSPAHLQPGQTVDGWRVVKPLGAGSFGAVYLVEKEGHHFAMKMAMHRASSGDAEQADARLLREMVCLSQVSGHPNVVEVHAHGRWQHPTQGWLYIILDYVEGYTLGEWVEKTHPTAHEVARVFGKLSGALAHLHSRGVFHRDLKLGNILVRATDGEPFILDFGVGDYTLAPELTDTPLPPGTRRYRSPEASRFLREHGDEQDARYEFKATDDVYALGVCLYDVLTNPQPVRETPRVLVGAQWPPPAPHALNPRVPVSLSAAAMHFIERHPEKRAPSAEVMRRELDALLHEEGEAWTATLHVPTPHLPLALEVAHNDVPQDEAQPSTPKRTPGRRVAGAVAILALVVASLVGYAALRPTAPTRQAQRLVEPPAPPPPTDAGAIEPVASSVPPTPPVSSPGVALPPPVPVEKESPPVKRAPARIPLPAESTARKPKALASRPSWPPSPWAGFLKTCAGATAAAALSIGCPGAQVRPEPGACPSEAREVMFRWEQKGGLRLSPGDSVLLTLDRRQPGFQGEAGTYADGPVTGVVLRSYLKGLPEGTRLSGYLWTSGEFLVGRYTEAELPDGRTVPVCFALGRRGYIEKWEESKPGATVVGRSNPAYPVERWP
ncbi:protein kinase [Myxococcus xanthus]|uniref:non-specific serine/threonine protein kinase n=1 Tax=Myxococcus xanthus TaxID=34 RepID=A0AAE6KRH7_MYXXA|nr:serine/threonine-protein kinase [Myxococcus xanthus]QDE67297.1 protein kinase [Myxococcus xanthus]QDE74572.1 protein kinase [Myxococcus xanthus]QDF05665.1 protein kinase [Myxococcus xanthus]